MKPGFRQAQGKHSDRGEALAPGAASVPQNGAAAPGAIAGQESVLPFSASFGGLILSLHVSSSLFEKSGGIV
jgi:hypothetical protein